MSRHSATRPNWVAGGLAMLWLVITAVPVLTMLSWAFQFRTDFVDHGPISLPLRPTLSNFTAVIDSGFLTYLKNTVIVTIACVALTLAIAIPAAYAIVRSHSWLAGTAFRVFLLGLAIPAQAVIIPVYLLVVRLQLYDTVWAIVLPTVAFGLPLVILVLAGSLRDITRDMYEAMTVDGAGAFRMLVNLVIPLSRGSITAVGIFAALHAWNGFIFPLVVTRSAENRVLTIGLQGFRTEYGINIPAMMMAVLLSALPVFVLYVLARRWLVAGFAGVGGK